MPPLSTGWRVVIPIMKILRLELDLYSLVIWTSRLVVTFRNYSHDIICTSNKKLPPWAVEFYLSTAHCIDLSILYEFVIWHMKHSTNSTCFRLKLFCLTLKNNTQQLSSDICYAFHIMLYNSLQNSWSLCHGSWSAHHFVGV